MEFTPVDAIVERYLSGEINPNFLYDDIIEYTLEDRGKYDCKPYHYWTTIQNTKDDYEKWKEIKPRLVEWCKKNKKETIFLSKISSYLCKLMDWEKAVIVWYSSTKPKHQEQHLYMMKDLRNALKD